MNKGEVLNLLYHRTGSMIPRTGDRTHLARCPAHDDKNPSLSVGEGSDGRVLFKCFAGCTLDAICLALGITTADLFPDKKQERFGAQSCKIEYLYKNEQGELLYKKIRIEPGFNGQQKSFYCERIDRNGNAIRDLSGCRKVLYRLPEVLKGIVEGEAVFLVEGEKDAEKLLLQGLIATTTSNSLEWSDDFTKMLKNADVVLLYDMDKTGLKRRDLLCTKLFGKVRRLRVVDLPGLEYGESHGKDVSDWLAMGHTVQELISIVGVTSDYAPQGQTIASDQTDKLGIVTMEDLLNLDLPEREMLLAPFLPTQGLAMVHAKRGVGKTHVALGIAYAVATGGSFFKWIAPVAKRVLYIDGEMPAVSMQERMRKLCAQSNNGFQNLKLITPDLQDGPMPDLSTQEGRDTLEEFVKDSDLIVIDNISTLFRSANENEAEGWQAAQDWALNLRRRGKSVLFVHHAGKNGIQRGTSKREDILDAVITLKHPDDYQFEQGARFEVRFEKARHFSGEEAMAFNVVLKEQAGGAWEWEVSGVSIEQDVLNIADMRKLGLTIETIMKETRLSKSKVETRIKWAKQRGLLD